MANGPKQPHKTPDYRARTAGPGAASRRTDLSGNQPIRVPTGIPYGEAKRVEQMQQMTRLPAAGDPLSGGGGGGMAPMPSDGIGQMRDVIDAVSGLPQATSPREVSTHEAVLALETLADSLGGAVTVGLMDLILRLKRESMHSPHISEADPDALRGLDDLDMPDQDLMGAVADADQQPLELEDEEMAEVMSQEPPAPPQPAPAPAAPTTPGA